MLSSSFSRRIPFGFVLGEPQSSQTTQSQGGAYCVVSRGVSLSAPWEVGVAWLDAKL